MPSETIQIFGEQLVDDSEEFVCKICMMVLVNPMVTKCSHLVCSECLTQWVNKNRTQAEKQRRQLDNVPCPVCQTPLLRQEVTLLSDSGKDPAQGACRLLWRLYNDQNVRCLHHALTQRKASVPLNERAAAAAQQHLNCDWEGPRLKYFPHLKECTVEIRLGGVAPKAASDEPKVEEVVEAGADWDGRGDSRALPFQEGDQLEVLFDDSTGWSYGRLATSVRNRTVREGWFPRAWTNPVQQSVQPKADRGTAIKRDYEARSQKELTVRVGDTCTVVRREQQWVLAAKMVNGQEQRGWIPEWALD